MKGGFILASILGENLKRLRKEKGLSLTDLSKSSGLGLSTISQIESGVRENLRSESLKKVSEALGVTVDSLFSIDQGEYVVNDLLESIQIILSDDDVQINNITMTQQEKDDFLLGVNLLIQLIKEKRD